MSSTTDCSVHFWRKGNVLVVRTLRRRRNVLHDRVLVLRTLLAQVR